MMRKIAVVTLLILCLISPVLAQDDCGDGLPCGRIPWDLPAMPPMPSPTYMPTFSITVQPTAGSATATPLPTNTPAPINTIDAQQIADQVATLESVLNSTPYMIVDAAGTPVDAEQTFVELGDNAGEFFGYYRSLSDAQFGSISPLIALSGFSLLVVVSLKALTITLPFISTLIGIIRKAIGLILDFLPL